MLDSLDHTHPVSASLVLGLQPCTTMSDQFAHSGAPHNQTASGFQKQPCPAYWHRAALPLHSACFLHALHHDFSCFRRNTLKVRHKFFPSFRVVEVYLRQTLGNSREGRHSNLYDILTKIILLPSVFHWGGRAGPKVSTYFRCKLKGMLITQ